jgi:NAD(P)-dependent dehydrogenase (short-subunit alcohol dehydrogenase family)
MTATIKVAIITGASQGIGAGLVAGFRRAGYAVVGNSRSIGSIDEPDYLTVEGDIAEAETARRVVDRALDRFGRIDSLINNAGIFIAKPFTDYTADDYAAIAGVNLAGFFPITQAAIRHMVTQGSGHIVNITTSIVDRASSKRPSALVALTKGSPTGVPSMELRTSPVRIIMRETVAARYDNPSSFWPLRGSSSPD